MLLLLRNHQSGGTPPEPPVPEPLISSLPIPRTRAGRTVYLTAEADLGSITAHLSLAVEPDDIQELL